MKNEKTVHFFFSYFSINFTILQFFKNFNQYSYIAVWPIESCHHENVT